MSTRYRRHCLRLRYVCGPESWIQPNSRHARSASKRFLELRDRFQLLQSQERTLYASHRSYFEIIYETAAPNKPCAWPEDGTQLFAYSLRDQTDVANHGDHLLGCKNDPL